MSEKPLSFLEEIEQTYHIARNLMLDGVMAEPVYFKCVLALAHDYMVLGKTDDAVALVAESTEAYLRNEMPAQMKEDPDFGAVVKVLARMLREANVKTHVTDEALDEALFMSLGSRGQA